MLELLRDRGTDPHSPEDTAFVVLSERLARDGHPAVRDMSDPLDALIYGLLVSRTSPTTAQTAFVRLRSRFPDWSALANTATVDVIEAIKATGFAQQRAVFIQKLVRRVQGDFPNGSYERLKDWDDATIESYLTSLPGVGIQIAHQVMLDALDRPILPLAQPILRLISRLGMGSNPSQLERTLRSVARGLVSEQRRKFHRDLLNHAQDVCRPRFPRCGNCCLNDLCSYYRQRRNDRSWRPYDLKQ